MLAEQKNRVERESSEVRADHAEYKTDAQLRGGIDSTDRESFTKIGLDKKKEDELVRSKTPEEVAALQKRGLIKQALGDASKSLKFSPTLTDKANNAVLLPGRSKEDVERLLGSETQVRKEEDSVIRSVQKFIAPLDSLMKGLAGNPAVANAVEDLKQTTGLAPHEHKHKHGTKTVADGNMKTFDAGGVRNIDDAGRLIDASIASGIQGMSNLMAHQTPAGIIEDIHNLKDSAADLTESIAQYAAAHSTPESIAAIPQELYQTIAKGTEGLSSMAMKRSSESVIDRGDIAGVIATEFSAFGFFARATKAVHTEKEFAKLLDKTVDEVIKMSPEELPRHGVTRIEPVNGRLPSNFRMAGKVVHLSEELTEELSKEYPSLADKFAEGVRFKENGFPDFKPFAKHEIQLAEGFRNRTKDFADANKLMGWKQEPLGWTWHHCEDYKTLQLVPTKLHNAIRHTGGNALAKAARKER